MQDSQSQDYEEEPSEIKRPQSQCLTASKMNQNFTTINQNTRNWPDANTNYLDSNTNRFQTMTSPTVGSILLAECNDRALHDSMLIEPFGSQLKPDDPQTKPVQTPTAAAQIKQVNLTPLQLRLLERQSQCRFRYESSNYYKKRDQILQQKAPMALRSYNFSTLSKTKPAMLITDDQDLAQDALGTISRLSLRHRKKMRVAQTISARSGSELLKSK